MKSGVRHSIHQERQPRMTRNSKRKTRPRSSSVNPLLKRSSGRRMIVISKQHKIAEDLFRRLQVLKGQKPRKLRSSSRKSAKCPGTPCATPSKRIGRPIHPTTISRLARDLKKQLRLTSVSINPMILRNGKTKHNES
ncbi:hypothetical protein HOLleu_16523 [Holothuria leucospilota]|uniref:Uncharacterized protein n=1 Tax=Holothuria leucospilota TaxID=206669 RepID=A0A9Q1HB10_HOLLE|nr:hypothetical protein HOLleu_16523 [Holothuria leucospilota]